jgi:hypothetical protein
MHEGRIAGELPRADLTEQNVMRLATGDTDDIAATTASHADAPERMGA